jgi:sugar lactone lactonase YvrE
MQPIKVEHFLPTQHQLGEGPRWDGRSGRLYWVDIRRGNFIRRHIQSGRMEQFYIGMPLGCLGFCRSEKLVMGTKAGFARWDLKSRTISMFPGLRIDEREIRFNDGAVDRAGRFWAGTIAPEGRAVLYRLDPDGSVRQMGDGFSTCNGIGWSLDNRLMYFTDTHVHTIYVYDFDLASGQIANRRIFARLDDPAGGRPDGLTVDAEGCIWSAMWDGWRVVRFDPQGKQMLELRLPVQRVTACIFGGPELEALYITSAWDNLSLEQRADQPMAGDLFVAYPGVKGLPEPLFEM